MAGQFGLRFRLPRKSQGSLTCRKAATWDRRLHFPSEGRHARDFFRLRNPTALARFELAILGTRGLHANHWTTEAAIEFFFFFLNKNLFARCKNTHISTRPYKIFTGQPISCRTLAVRGVTVLPGQVTAGTAVKKWHKGKKTLQQKGMRSEENVFGTFMYTANPHITRLIRSQKSSRNTKTRKVNN
jgi:hypothetical protein